MQPELLNQDLLNGVYLNSNTNSMLNLLKCLGFSIQHNNVHSIRDENDKKVLLFPDARYLDLNIRLSHVLGSLVELCFYYDENTTGSSAGWTLNTDYSTLNSTSNSSTIKKSERIKKNDHQIDQLSVRIKSIVYNLEVLLPLDDKPLLLCLIDIMALTKFSPEIVLSLTDYSVFYALNYYEIFDKNKYANRLNFGDLMRKEILNWHLNKNKEAIRVSNLNKIEANNNQMSIVKYSVNNKVLNFFLSIGYEIIGPWLRFCDSDLNRNLLDLVLKLFTSFNTDRDMSLYKDFNINVIGESSTRTTHRFAHTASSSRLKKSDINETDNKEAEIDNYKVCLILFFLIKISFH
jgi:hypothetical protein